MPIFRQLSQCLVKPSVELLQKWTGPALSNGFSLIGRLPSNLAFNDIERCNPLQCQGGQWRGLVFVDIVELTPGVSPTGGFLDRIRAI